MTGCLFCVDIGSVPPNTQCGKNHEKCYTKERQGLYSDMYYRFSLDTVRIFLPRALVSCIMVSLTKSFFFCAGIQGCQGVYAGVCV